MASCLTRVERAQRKANISGSGTFKHYERYDLNGFLGQMSLCQPLHYTDGKLDIHS